MPNATWMSDLASQIGNRKLREIALPGTHDSGTYNIGATSSFSTDDNGKTLNIIDDFLIGAVSIDAIASANPLLAPICLTIAALAGGSDAVFREAVANYSRTQSQSIYNQLLSGIRYLDLRVCVDGSQIYTCHGMLGSSIDEILGDVAKFQKANPQEIVLLDFNHFYSFEAADHQTLINKIKSTLGSAIVPSTVAGGLDVTLNDLWIGKGRLIVFYRDDQAPDKIDPNVTTTAAANSKVVWGASKINSHWFSDVEDLAELYTAMEGEFGDPANKGVFWVNQGIVSPQAYVTYIVEHLFSSLYNEAKKITPAVTDWIHYLWAGSNPPLNIVIVNFFELSEYVDAIRALNQLPNSTWVACTSPQNKTFDPSSLYADLAPVTCPEGETVIGIQFQKSSNLAGTTAGNRLMPVLVTRKLDGTGKLNTHYGTASGSATSQLKNLSVDTTPLFVPEDMHVVGFQFMQSDKNKGFPNSNRLVPVLICRDAAGKNETKIYNTAGNNNYSALSKAQMVSNQISVPQGGAISGFQFLISSENSGFAIGGQTLPALLYDMTLTAAVEATWSAGEKVSSSGIQESDKDHKDKGIWFNCPSGQLMVGRRHDKDENGDTYYYTAPIKFSVEQDNQPIIHHISWQAHRTSSLIVECDGVYYQSSDNCAMTGRWHEGDEKGNTQYKDGTISFPDLDQTKTVLGYRRWTPGIKESYSDYTCPANCVLTGRWHDGDENKNTRYEYARIFVLPA